MKIIKEFDNGHNDDDILMITGDLNTRHKDNGVDQWTKRSIQDVRELEKPQFGPTCKRMEGERKIRAREE